MVNLVTCQETVLDGIYVLKTDEARKYPALVEEDESHCLLTGQALSTLVKEMQQRTQPVEQWLPGTFFPMECYNYQMKLARGSTGMMCDKFADSLNDLIDSYSTGNFRNCEVTSPSTTQTSSLTSSATSSVTSSASSSVSSTASSTVSSTVTSSLTSTETSTATSSNTDGVANGNKATAEIGMNERPSTPAQLAAVDSVGLAVAEVMFPPSVLKYMRSMDSTVVEKQFGRRDRREGNRVRRADKYAVQFTYNLAPTVSVAEIKAASNQLSETLAAGGGLAGLGVAIPGIELGSVTVVVKENPNNPISSTSTTTITTTTVTTTTVTLTTPAAVYARDAMDLTQGEVVILLLALIIVLLMTFVSVYYYRKYVKLYTLRKIAIEREHAEREAFIAKMTVPVVETERKRQMSQVWGSLLDDEDDTKATEATPGNAAREGPPPAYDNDKGAKDWRQFGLENKSTRAQANVDNFNAKAAATLTGEAKQDVPGSKSETPGSLTPLVDPAAATPGTPQPLPGHADDADQSADEGESLAPQQPKTPMFKAAPSFPTLSTGGSVRLARPSQDASPGMPLRPPPPPPPPASGADLPGTAPVAADASATAEGPASGSPPAAATTSDAVKPASTAAAPPPPPPGAVVDLPPASPSKPMNATRPRGLPAPPPSGTTLARRSQNTANGVPVQQDAGSRPSQTGQPHLKVNQPRRLNLRQQSPGDVAKPAMERARKLLQGAAPSPLAAQQGPSNPAPRKISMALPPGEHSKSNGSATNA